MLQFARTGDPRYFFFVMGNSLRGHQIPQGELYTFLKAIGSGRWTYPLKDRPLIRHTKLPIPIPQRVNQRSPGIVSATTSLAVPTAASSIALQSG